MLAVSSLRVSSAKSTLNKKTQSVCLGALHSACIGRGGAAMQELPTSWFFNGAVTTRGILIPLGIDFPLSWRAYTIITVVCATWPRLWGWLATKKLKSLLLAQRGTLCWECPGPKCLQTHFSQKAQEFNFHCEVSTKFFISQDVKKEQFLTVPFSENTNHCAS